MTTVSLTEPRRGVRGRSPRIDELEMKARVNEILNRHPAVGLAVGVVRDGSLEFFHGHGLADIASHRPITEDTVFRIGSITKTFTAVAVMQLWEQGLVDLDAPANDYLRAYQLIPSKAGFRPATVRHLLTHTAGIPQMVRSSRALLLAPSTRWVGESFGLDQIVPTLAEYYRGRLRVVVEPGTRFTYTDHGLATVGQIVEDVSGEPLARYFREHIFEPLGMVDTDLLRSDRVTSRLATGYTLDSHGPKAVIDRQGITAAAGEIYSTPRDMGRYLAALLGGGTNEHGMVLKPETVARMFEPQYQPDPRLPGMGLAFWRCEFGGHRAVEHQGIVPGFNSQIFVAPDDGVGVMAFTNGARNAVTWLVDEGGRLLSQVIGAPENVIRSEVPQHPEMWGEICGSYRVWTQPTDMMARLMGGLGAEVVVHRGRLMVRAMSPIPAIYRGFVLHPDDAHDPYVFRVDLSPYGMGTVRVAFTRESGAVTAFHLEMPPMSFRKQPNGGNPRSRILGGLAVAGSTGLGRRYATRRRQRRRSQEPGPSPLCERPDPRDSGGG